jgi:hypothetical protein
MWHSCAQIMRHQPLQVKVLTVCQSWFVFFCETYAGGNSKLASLVAKLRAQLALLQVTGAV